MVPLFIIKSTSAGMMKYMILLFMTKIIIRVFQIHSNLSPPHHDVRPCDCPVLVVLTLRSAPIRQQWNSHFPALWGHLLSILLCPWSMFFLHPFPHLPYLYYIDCLGQCVIIVVFVVDTIQFAFDYTWFFIVLSLCLPN